MQISFVTIHYFLIFLKFLFNVFIVLLNAVSKVNRSRSSWALRMSTVTVHLTLIDFISQTSPTAELLHGILHILEREKKKDLGIKNFGIIVGHFDLIFLLNCLQKFYVNNIFWLFLIVIICVKH